MKYFVSVAVFLLFAGWAFGQSASVKTSDFRAEVQKELQTYHHGAELYQKCDLFARIVNQRVASRLKVAQDAVEESFDTTENDISKSSSDQNETSIAISRANPNIIVAGANDASMASNSMPAYVSTDAGRTWKTHRLPKVDDNGVTALGDPMIVSGDSGYIYYAFLIGTGGPGGGPTISDLIVARTTDGVKWTLGSPVLGASTPDNLFEDKETIAVDRDSASPYFGRLYIVWTHYDDNGSATTTTQIAYSDDRGDTWSAAQEIATSYGYFALVRCGKGGTVFIGSSAYDANATSSHGMIVSTDGGQTFNDNTIGDYDDYPTNANGLNGLKGMDGFRAFPYVSFDVDPKNNDLYAAYGTYDANGDAAQYTVTSTDAGQSWTTPKQIGSAGMLGNDHFDPWVCFDPITRQVNVTMYSSEEDTIENIKTRAVHCAFESTDKLEWLGTDLFDPTTVTIDNWDFIGDYIGADAWNGTLASSWTENRPHAHDGEIYAYVSAPFTAGSGGVRQINATEFSVTDASPNPVLGTFATFHVSTNTDSPILVQLFDLRGVQIQSFTTHGSSSDDTIIEVDTHRLMAGVYRATFRSEQSVVEKNLVVLR